MQNNRKLVVLNTLFFLKKIRRLRQSANFSYIYESIPTSHFVFCYAGFSFNLSASWSVFNHSPPTKDASHNAGTGTDTPERFHH